MDCRSVHCQTSGARRPRRIFSSVKKVVKIGQNWPAEVRHRHFVSGGGGGGARGGGGGTGLHERGNDTSRSSVLRHRGGALWQRVNGFVSPRTRRLPLDSWGIDRPNGGQGPEPWSCVVFGAICDAPGTSAQGPVKPLPSDLRGLGGWGLEANRPCPVQWPRMSGHWPRSTGVCSTPQKTVYGRPVSCTVPPPREQRPSQSNSACCFPKPLELCPARPFMNTPRCQSNGTCCSRQILGLRCCSRMGWGVRAQVVDTTQCVL